MWQKVLGLRYSGWWSVKSRFLEQLSGKHICQRWA